VSLADLDRTKAAVPGGMIGPHPARLDDVARRLPLYSLGAYVLVTVVLGLIADVVYGTSGKSAAAFDGPDWLDAQFRGDSGWYYGIAKNGYSYVPGQQCSVAFFPAYPMIVRIIGLALGRDYVTAAGLVTLVCGAGVVMLFAAWVRARLEARAAVVAVGLLLLYPYSFFLYGSGYGEATFLLATLGAFALLERRHYALAAIVGAVATAGRPVGIAVTVGLVVRAVELIAQDRRARPEAAVQSGAAVSPTPFSEMVDALRNIRGREASLFLSASGLVAWMTYLGVRFGDPLAFAHVQGAPGWGQEPGLRTLLKVRIFQRIYRGDWHVLVLMPQIVATIAAVLLLRVVWRRFGWGYAAYVAVSLAIPIIGTKDFMGLGRYILSAFPVIAAAAVFLTNGRPRWLVPTALPLCFLGMCFALIKYVQGVDI